MSKEKRKKTVLMSKLRGYNIAVCTLTLGKKYTNLTCLVDLSPGDSLRCLVPTKHGIALLSAKVT